jgi:KaiC/GvpD/RAD55 family RecA-like ATPase
MGKNQVLAFSEEQQEAVIGHTFNDQKVWDLLDSLGFTKEWILDNATTRVVGYIEKYRETFGRPPSTIQELLEQIKEEPAYKKHAETVLNRCLEAAKVHKLDVLKAKFVSWAKSSVIRNRYKEIAQEFNAGNHEEACKLFDKTALELQVLDVASGSDEDSFRPSVQRLDGEEIRRVEEAKRGIPYGIRLLDEATAGIPPNDLIVVGGRSGVGKTELARIVATNVAATRPVFYFALEAEQDEIERRTKYSKMASLYRANHTNIPRGKIDYMRWRKSLLTDELDKPYGNIAHEEACVALKNLQTYYRKGGDFTIDNLNRKIYEIYRDASLIVVDHIHYVDFEGGDENREMKRLIGTVRKVSLTLGVPVLCVAHLRKADRGKDRALVPNADDFHGSSDIVKTSTTCILMGSAKGLVSSDSRAVGKATFMRLPKVRLSGSLLYYCSVTFFDTITNEYRPDYSLGHLNFSETKWKPEARDQIPFWAKSAVIQDVSEIDNT